LKKFWKLLLKDSANLNSTNFYPRANFRHSLLSDSEIVDRLLDMSDELEEAYDYYQTLLTAMHTKNEVLLHKLLQTNYCELPKGFKRVQRTLRKHEREILSSFVIGISNGPIEGKMNKVKVLKRISYGYRNFNNFRTRILLATKSNKLTITK
ncbi:transposase, partial [Limosilactobacillus equigenerosi]|uniref:transposase n=1 Tax=Limosilactobacillus equigenerosi TaxID=417373 RepID=UPI000AB01742